MPCHTESVIVGKHGVKVWAGKASDPFYVEPTILGAVRQAVATGALRPNFPYVAPPVSG